MKKITNTIKVLFVTVFALTTTFAFSQTVTEDTEVKKKEKKITIKKVKEIDGKKVKWDTTLVITDENREEVEKYLQENGMSMAKRVKVHIDEDRLKEKIARLEEHEIFIKELGERMDGEELERKIEVIVKEAKEHAGENVWVSGNGKVFTIDGNKIHMDVHGDSLEKHMKLIVEAHGDELKEIEWTAEHKADMEKLMKEHQHKIILHKEKLGDMKKKMKEVYAIAYADGKAHKLAIESLDSMNIDFDFDFDVDNDFVFEVDADGDHDVVFVGKGGDHAKMKKMWHAKKGDKHGNVMFFGDDHFSFDMTMNEDLEEEDFAVLKKAGIKKTENELDIDKLHLKFEDDEFGLIFKLKTEGKATIKVVDSEGELVFNDKVQYFPGTYHKSMGLSTEQTGKYFIYIEQGGKAYSTKFTIN